MSSNGSDSTLHIRLRPSRVLALVLLFMHGGAMAVMVPAGLSPWLTLLISAGIVTSLVHTLKAHALLRARNAVVQLVWDAEGEWTLLTAAGQSFKARLLPTTYLHPHVVILNFRRDHRWGSRAVVVLPDAVDADTFRRLRVRLATHRR
jgi:toxin CptA